MTESVAWEDQHRVDRIERAGSGELAFLAPKRSLALLAAGSLSFFLSRCTHPFGSRLVAVAVIVVSVSRFPCTVDISPVDSTLLPFLCSFLWRAPFRLLPRISVSISLPITLSILYCSPTRYCSIVVRPSIV